VDNEFLGGRKKIVKDYVFKWSVKNTLSLSFLNNFSNFITLISLIFCHFTNIKDIFKD